MKISEYQQLAMRTSGEGHDRILNGCLGLMGEAGEVVDVIKKWRFQSGENAPFPAAELVNEIGDILWYCAELCTGRGIDLARVVEYVNLIPNEALEADDYSMAPPEFHAYGILLHSLRVYDEYFFDIVESPGTFKIPTKWDQRGEDEFDIINSDEPQEIVYNDEAEKMVPGQYDLIIHTLTTIITEARIMLEQFAGSSLAEAMEINIDKLRKRYPDGFDPERSLHRSE